MKQNLSAAVWLLLSLGLLTQVKANPYVIWSNGPAKSWERTAYPLGNGNLGCMIFGDPAKEKVQFNEDSLWVGGESDTGCYQNFGTIHFDLPHSKYSSYRRELDISRAVQTITYSSGGVSYKRECFASNPGKVMVFRYTADKAKSLSGKVYIEDAHKGSIKAEGNRIIVTGDLADWQVYDRKGRKRTWDNPTVLDYEAQLLVMNEGGSLQADGKAITFKDCDSLTFLVSADTNYINQREKGWKTEHPHKNITANLDRAAKQDYTELLTEHIEDYQSLFNRMSIDLGSSSDQILAQTTGKRLGAYQDGSSDPDLEELLYQHARDLMISCSRPGTLPANLQGMWNQENGPPWRCDYHSDVNLQMNYWFVDQANLSECYKPLAEWFYAGREVRREHTLEHFGKRGIAMLAENGIFGGSTWKWSIGDASWLTNNLYSHYRYTLDKDILRDRVYPLLKDCFMFWEDHLIEIPAPSGKGTVLVGPNGYSPEHGPHQDGVSFDQQLCWDLLTNFAEASEVLGVDASERTKALAMREQLLGPQIGSWGQLQEWMVDRDDPEDDHRHLSHMIAVHPGRQISPLTSPEFAEAAKVSMHARGYGGTGWSRAWKISIWARLYEAEKSYKMIRNLMSSRTLYSNLFAAHPPFQIDGNFGYAGGVNEMLLQSHMDYIDIIPALPAAWPEGEVAGMRARGDAEVDLKWSGGTLVSVTVKAGDQYQALPLVYKGKRVMPNLKSGQTKTVSVAEFR
ncbi:MAG: glycoside hydrolase family 95 protein [Verrucomicrobiota bacterium]